jgi:hypothetical protein
MRKSIFLAGLLLAALLFTTCHKTGTFQTVKLEDMMKLQVGKYIIYKLDSLKYVNFDQTLEATHYQAKDVVDAAITDNKGRPAWRVIRYLRDSASTSETDWKPNITYMITVLSNSVEAVEENQRYIKLVQPIKEDFTWKGNAYINPESFDASFSIDAWDYTYTNIFSPFVFNDGRMVDSTITVNQRDEVLGDTSNPYSYSIQNFSKEVYGKNIGLIYKELFHSEHQSFYDVSNCYYVKCPGSNCDTVYCAANDYICEADRLANGYTKYCSDTTLTQSYYLGYGIKLRMIDHN